MEMNKREKHNSDDEKGKLSESPRQMNSSSICGNVNGVEEEHSRIQMKHFPNGCGEKRRTAEMMGRRASRLATFGFSLCLLSLKYSKPVLKAQQPHPLWLSIISMVSFTLFASAATVMLIVGASFTHMQTIVMLIAFFTLVLA